MDVSRAAGIETGLDRAENVFTRRARQKFAVSLEVGVAIRDRASGVNVGSVVVGLPDLNESVPKGAPLLPSMRPFNHVTWPTAGVRLSLMRMRSLSRSSGILSG